MVSVPPTVLLRPYQEACVANVLGARDAGIRRALYVLPTGCGKTVTFSELIRRIREKDDRPALVLAHREELLVQASDTIRRMMPYLTVEIERGEQRASRFAEVVVASLPTVARAGTTRLDWLADMRPSVIVYDEAHHAAAEGAGRALARFGAFARAGDGPDTFLVGCTATPHRLDNKPLEGADGQATFEKLAYSYTLLEAIREGWLCDMRGFILRTETDLSGVGTRGGDFAEGELARRVNNDARTERAAIHWKEIAGDRSTIVFCASVEHAEDAAQHWKAVGASAEVLHGGMDRDDRRATLDRFRRGVTQVLTNCMIATEGFDHPPVACIVLLRPTKSWSLYAQMVGRGTRLFPGKADSIVLDVVDNCDEHNLITAPRLLDLPPGVDLDGGSLLEAREELDELGERAAHLPAKPGKWKDLKSRALEVPLFTIPTTPPEVAKFGKFRWIAFPGRYVLDCGRAQTSNPPQVAGPAAPPSPRRVARITETALGWECSLIDVYEASERVCARLVESELEGAIRRTENAVRSRWPSSVGIVDRSASFNADPPTPAQLRLIRLLIKQKGVADYDPAAVRTKGDASALITSLKG